MSNTNKKVSETVAPTPHTKHLYANVQTSDMFATQQNKSSDGINYYKIQDKKMESINKKKAIDNLVSVFFSTIFSPNDLETNKELILLDEVVAIDRTAIVTNKGNAVAIKTRKTNVPAIGLLMEKGHSPTPDSKDYSTAVAMIDDQLGRNLWFYIEKENVAIINKVLERVATGLKIAFKGRMPYIYSDEGKKIMLEPREIQSLKKLVAITK